MTKNGRPKEGRPKEGRPKEGLAWKSGLVASCVGVVLAGSGWLGRVDQTPVVQTPPQPRVIVVQLPVSAGGGLQPTGQTRISASAGVQTIGQTDTTRTQIIRPPRPQKPVFQQPVTRTRGS